MNKEHFWPQWLIEKTGAKGVRHSANKRVNPRSLKVPLCKKCNSDFGDALEVPVSKIVRDLEGGDGLSDSEAEILVRWLWKFEGLNWIFDHPAQRYTERYTLRDRVLNPIDEIREELTLAVSLVAAINPRFDDEPMGLDSWNEQSAVFVAGVFGRIAMMVLLSQFESEVPDAYSLYRFAHRDAPDRSTKLFFPKTGFTDCVEAVGVSMRAGGWLSYAHDREMRDRVAAAQRRPL